MKTLLAVGFDKIGFMMALLLVLMVWSGSSPADRTVWMVESVWSVGLLAVLAVTRKWFKFSTAAIDGGEVGAAFLGSQGDVWDAQKDILCDTLGGAVRSGRILWLSQTLKCCRGIDEWYGIWYYKGKYGKGVRLCQ